MSLSKTLIRCLELVQHRKTGNWPDMTKKLLTLTLCSNTNKQNLNKVNAELPVSESSAPLKYGDIFIKENHSPQPNHQWC